MLLTQKLGRPPKQGVPQTSENKEQKAPFKRGVAGSNPARLTNKNKHIDEAAEGPILAISGMSFADYIQKAYSFHALADLAPDWKIVSTRELRLLAESILGPHPLDQLTSAHVAQWWGYHKARGFPVAANKQRQWLRQALRHAVALRLIPYNPADAIRKMKENKPRKPTLTEAQRTAILEECERSNPRILRYVWLAKYTIVRRSSLIEVRKEDIDFERGIVTYRHMKQGSPLTVPVPPECLDRLRVWAAEPGPLLHPYKSKNSVTQAFRRVCRSVGIFGFSLHDLRHDLGSALTEQTGNLALVRDLGGWQSLAMVSRYVHTKESSQRAAITQLFEKRTNGNHGAPTSQS